MGTADGNKILVVDDEESMREVLQFMLQREGYQVDCAENGRQAVTILKKRRYDLVLCDIRLGDMTGIDILKVCKDKNPAAANHFYPAPRAYVLFCYINISVYSL